MTVRPKRQYRRMEADEATTDVYHLEAIEIDAEEAQDAAEWQAVFPGEATPHDFVEPPVKKPKKGKGAKKDKGTKKAK